MRTFHLPIDPSTRERQLVVSELKSVNKVVVAVFNMSKNADQNFGIQEGTLSLVKELTESGKEVVVVIFGNSEAKKLFLKASAVVAAHDESKQAQLSAWKLLF